MVEQEDKPKWLLELENRKRKPKLAHETGAGASCLICESACPGLDLHFWRKICKNCKCRGDDHDIDDDDFPQFELLFGLNVKKRNNRSILLQVHDKKQHQSETSFDWVPPDTTKELAEDYMKALPLAKLPIKGSAGAAFRRQQLQKQLPLHDIDYKACDALSEQERKEFEKYLDNLKNCAGQGKVTKLTSIKPFNQSLMTPANATDVQQFSPQHNQQLLNPNRVLNLRTPSSFISKVPLSQTKSNLPCIPNNDNTSIPSNIEVIKGPHLQAANEDQQRLGQYHHTLANVSNQGNLAEATNVLGDYHLRSDAKNPNNQNIFLPNENKTFYDPKSFKNLNSVTNEENAQCDKIFGATENVTKLGASEQKLNSASEKNVEPLNDIKYNNLLAEQMLFEALLPPSAANSNNIVGSSLDKNELKYIREKLSNKYSSNKNDYKNPAVSRELENLSHPSSLISNSEDIKRDSDKAKPILNDSNKNQFGVPLLAKPSDHLRTQLNVSSIPQANVIHSEILNNPVFPENAIGASVAYQNPENIEKLTEEMEGITMNLVKLNQCHECGEDIHCGNVVVTAEKIKDAVWHPGCFVCSACNELLVDLVYFTYKGKLYCGRDLAKLLEMPRCFACDELIFVREYTVAEGHNYHVKHFCCWDCDIPLAGKQYISENDRPLCLPCYQENYAKTCNACNNVIAADQQGVAIKNLNFHATSNCFCCFICKKSLLGGQIAVKNNKPLCSKNCIAEFLQL